ncbi:MAG: MogA/MoaB family molybdenum cofactor biosynthesis protein [Solirubrobacterales bacterium]
MRAAVLTVSDSRAGGEAEDRSGPLLADYAESLGFEVVEREVVPDERPLIAERLRHLADGAVCELILTTGGTGFAQRDVTPEATRDVIDREAPGMAEAMRAASRDHTRFWMASRGVVGSRGATLIVNFPGSPKAIAEAGEGVREAIPHAVGLLAG